MKTEVMRVMKNSYDAESIKAMDNCARLTAYLCVKYKLTTNDLTGKGFTNDYLPAAAGTTSANDAATGSDSDAE